MLYIPRLTKGLYYVGSIVDKGFTIHFSPHECHVIDNHSNLTLLNGVWDSMNSLYRIDGSTFINYIEVHIFFSYP